jgi:serine/threonine protein kinase
MKTHPQLLQPSERLAGEIRGDQGGVVVESPLQGRGARMDPFARSSMQVARAEPIGAIRLGSVIAGNYRVDRVISEGALHQVFAATHVQHGHRVALQMLRPEAARRTEVATRFLREARAAERIQGEHAAKVLEVGTLESGVPYMATEYLEGTDLARFLRGRGPLPLPELVELGLQICEALAEAHAAGVVHKNLEPAKLFLTTRPDHSPLVKVLAFGISRMSPLDPCENGAMTATAVLPSSPLYRAPEQLRPGPDIDTRADIWAIGVILFELAAGTPPFFAPTPLDLAVAITREPPRALRVIRPDLPKELEKLILRCLEKDPAKRFARVADLASALRKLSRAR